eukprot:150371-Amorphochlora_amoeboformis.AAC.1
MKPTFIPSLDDFISTLIGMFKPIRFQHPSLTPNHSEYGFETKDYSTRGKSESGRRGGRFR